MKTKKETLIIVSAIIISLLIFVIGYIILPDILITQITISGAGNTMPKILGLGLPLLITIITSFMYYKYKNISKYIISLTVCAVIYALIFFMNR